MLYTEPDIGTQAGTDTAYVPSGRSVRCSPNPFNPHSTKSYGFSALRRSFYSCPSCTGQERFFMPFSRIRPSSRGAACRRSSAPPPQHSHPDRMEPVTRPALHPPCPGNRCAIPSGQAYPLRYGTMSSFQRPAKEQATPKTRLRRYRRTVQTVPGSRNSLPSSRWTTSARRICTSRWQTWASGEDWHSAPSATPCSSPAQWRKSSGSGN